MANRNNRSRPKDIEKVANEIQDAILNNDESSEAMGVGADLNNEQKQTINNNQKETLEKIKEDALEELQHDQLEN